MNAIALILSTLLLSAAAQDPEADRLRKEVERLKADHETVLRQLEVALAQVKELSEKLSKTPKEGKPSAGAQGTGIPLAEALAKDLKALEEKHAEMARDKEKLKAATQALATGYRHFTYQGKVTAVADEIGMVVISIGKDDGVVEGHEFSITRAGEDVGTVVIDRADRKWAAGKVTRKNLDPRVGDDLFLKKVGAGKPVVGAAGSIDPVTAPAISRSSADELRAIRKELDEVRSQVRQLSDRMVPSWQGQGISVDEASEELRAHLAILRGLLVRRVKEGSAAERAGLKVNDVVPDLLEAQLVQALEMGMPIHVIRQGQRVRLPGATGK